VIAKILRESGTRQAEMIRSGAVSSVELVREHLARIDEINPKLNAAVQILREPALRAAESVDRRRAAGEPMRPLEGVPFSVKDSIEVQGAVCSAGTLGFRERERSKKDATLVARLRDAGAIPIARTNQHAVRPLDWAAMPPGACGCRPIIAALRA